ncbi:MULTISPECIES: ABC transporter ATP-binding protein [Paraburkholderia]|uniref:ABC transporter ATP-binding protein n=1 Tax=Paraburkholderia TaxID=1822464 RepID=UPI002255257E|nr:MULTISPECIES: ABC transporter ATP-binding protein [Paraburkholderia]MCX4162788.1 ABC transporter ATP-binding protein [Paraburkholderia megapolitana]MDN7158283.1 ABC transporter ATP-binding protein/permease [Paraburkholderia sp. CHISQ3]MDQ6495330.1 ABC transporter ATP-binding protein/permease [Paraburkholderia megapolitana]
MAEAIKHDAEAPTARGATASKTMDEGKRALTVGMFIKGRLRVAWRSLSAAVAAQVISVMVTMYTTRMIGNTMESAGRNLLTPEQLGVTFAVIAGVLLCAIGARRYGDRAVLLHILEVSCEIVLVGYRSCRQRMLADAGDELGGAAIRKVLRARQNYDAVISNAYFTLLPAIVGIPFAICVTAIDSWPGALAMLVCLLPMLFATVSYGRRHVTPLLRESAALDSRLSAELSDVLGNHETVTAWDTHQYETTRLSWFCERWRERTGPAWKQLVDNAMLQNALATVTLIVPLAVVAACALAGHGSVGAATTVVGASFVLRSSLAAFGKATREFYTSISDLREFVDLLNTPQDDNASRELPAFRDGKMDIQFDNVSFLYEGRSGSGIRGIDLTIASNQMVGVVGSSGSGKTTLLKILLGINQPTSGRILIAGQDLALVEPGSLRRRIAIVAQDAPMFARTLLENMTYGIDWVSQEEIDEVVRAIGLGSLVDSLPDGYQTQVGERGASLSGGERQRVAIARALLSGRPLLIFDEATANLDAVTEASAQTAIERLAGEQTCIVVAHRISTLRNADRIVVLSGGRIVADGNHDELVRSGNSAYQRLLGTQASSNGVAGTSPSAEGGAASQDNPDLISLANETGR